MKEPKPSSKERKREWLKIVNLVSASLQLLYWGILGEVKEASAQAPTRLSNENITTYFNRTGLNLVRDNNFTKTVELYSRPEEKRLTEFIKTAKDSNFYIDYLSFRQTGRINAYPNRETLRNELREIITKNLEGKLVNSSSNAEFKIDEIRISCQQFSEKRIKIIPGLLEAEQIEPSIEIEIPIIDLRSKLREQEACVLKFYSKISIKDLSRRATGSFNDNELNDAIRTGMKILSAYLENLKVQSKFVEITESKSLTRRFFSVEKPIIADNIKNEEFKGVYYPLILSKEFVNYFKPGDEIEVFILTDEGKEIVIEKYNLSIILDNYDKEENKYYIFIKSGNFSEPISFQKSIEEKLNKSNLNERTKKRILNNLYLYVRKSDLANDSNK